MSVAFPNDYVGRVIGKGGSRDAMNVGGAIVWLSVSMTFYKGSHGSEGSQPYPFYPFLKSDHFGVVVAKLVRWFNSEEHFGSDWRGDEVAEGCN